MRRFVVSLVLFLLASSYLEARHVILCGGPALRKWENLRVKKDRHDRWWANFVRASTIRMDQLKIEYGTSAEIVWLVYKPGYTTRASEDGKPYTQWIQEQASKRGAKLKWISSGQGVINTINSQPAYSIKSFDFFGHSNKYCMLLDYSNQMIGASKAWIHEKDLYKLRSQAFSGRAVCKSYGCHSGESMSKHWRLATGVPLIGADGKTDYTVLADGIMPVVVGKWVN